MTGLPKFVRDRLGRAVGGAPADHPDANLLAGFLERSLTSRERSLVLGHLAQCIQCREQVSMVLPELEAQMASPRAHPTHGWLRWPVLRWGLLVASLAIMGVVALVRQPPARRMELASRSNTAPPRATSLPSDVTVGAAPSRTSRPRGAKESALTQGRSQNDELALVTEAMREKAAPGGKPIVEPQLKQELQSSKAAPAEGFRTSPNAINGGTSNQPSADVVAHQGPPPAAPLFVAPTHGQPAQPLDLPASRQPWQAEASRAPEQDKGVSAGQAVGGAIQALPPPEEASHLAGTSTATPRTRPSTLAKAASSPPASLATSNALLASLPTAEWSISAAGKVQRSRDGGKSWEELDVDRNAVFRVVFAVGPDVWLGGTKGALYHSTDGGQHWTRVNITAGSATVTDDVTHIDFKDAQHGMVKTAGGDTWTTLDAGQGWQKQ